MRYPVLRSEILRFIVENHYKPGDFLPTIQEISAELGVSVAKIREALEIARELGMVEIKPGRGTRVLDYRFEPAVTLSALYAIGQNSEHFEHLRQLRSALEIAFWEEAVSKLSGQDIARLRALIEAARDRLATRPIQVPASEHRLFHLTIFSRLDNPFVQGLLEAFWEVYDEVGMNLYYELDYHRAVWEYHEQIVDAIASGKITEGRLLLERHMNLLQDRELKDAGELES